MGTIVLRSLASMSIIAEDRRCEIDCVSKAHGPVFGVLAQVLPAGVAQLQAQVHNWMVSLQRHDRHEWWSLLSGAAEPRRLCSEGMPPILSAPEQHGAEPRDATLRGCPSAAAQDIPLCDSHHYQECWEVDPGANLG